MIPETKVDEVKTLLRAGKLSQRGIARRTGVSRGAVASIANGTRPNYAERRLRHGTDRGPFDGPLERCPGCGGKAFMPCRLCQVRALKEFRRQSTPADDALGERTTRDGERWKHADNARTGATGSRRSSGGQPFAERPPTRHGR